MNYSCNEKDLRVIGSFAEKASFAKNERDLRQAEEEYWNRLSREAQTEESVIDLWHNIVAMSFDLVRHKAASADNSRARRILDLGPEEREIFEQVGDIIDENAFTYHFQPIVDASSGEIYSYEALMRPEGREGITPYTILKYAELSDRLGEIEKLTFLNVLGAVENEGGRFFGRPVFINSIPNVRLSDEVSGRINALLKKHSGDVVVEITEGAEYDEYQLSAVKERYGVLDIKLAIDDYGTGFSNVKNLLRYMPEYVKIDRELLSGISKDLKKKHFVREIVDFCHDNGILALAEGVETSEELRTVILFGVDLIQGYYTARPSAEVIGSIPSEIKQEIVLYRQERQDGKAKQIYKSAPGEHVMLERLVKESYSCVFVGEECSGTTVTVMGRTNLDTDIHIVTAPGFQGTLAIENVHLSNVKGRPCIDIGEGSRTELKIIGESRLMHTGIRVPEKSALMVTGQGSVFITLDGTDYYGIGNDLSSRNGSITMCHNALIEMESISQSGVLIGSGLGGEISINSGKYVLRSGGKHCVGIGAYNGDVDLRLRECDIEANISGELVTVLGSMNGKAHIDIRNSSFRSHASGEVGVAIGTVRGSFAKIAVDCTNTVMTLLCDDLAAMGSFDGDSDIVIERALVRINAGGNDAMAFGGSKGETSLIIHYADCAVNFTTTNQRITKAVFKESSDMPRCRVILNGEETYL
ncbi:MAG: EAL domain-containing protein [Ruminococcus sp.]|nr:EAL domain-containing protein [Ruminococcus sp.]